MKQWLLNNIVAVLALLISVGGGVLTTGIAYGSITARLTALEKQQSALWDARAKDHDVLTGHNTAPAAVADFYKPSALRASETQPASH